MPFLHAAVAAAHALGAAAWFGAMFYSFAVLHPRGRAFFESDRDFEDFIAFVSAGARWKVLGAFALVASTGFALLPLTAPGRDRSLWDVLVLAKVALWLIALAVFCYTSWRLWPRRVLAGPAEVPGLQRTFRVIGATMLALVGTSFVLGVAAHALRG